MKSKFKYWVVFSAVLVVVFFSLFVLILKIIFQGKSQPNAGIFFALFLFLFTWVWLLFGELRTKILKVTLSDGQVKVSRYFGLGKSQVYDLKEFEGFVTAVLPSKYDTYEYLYLIKEGKRQIAISQFYHRNYNELKNVLKLSVNDLGEKQISLFEHVKDIFR